MSNSKHKNSFHLVWILIGLLLLAVVGAVAARYVSHRMHETELHATDFHFASDVLSYNFGSRYTVSDWSTNGIQFRLYNYELENVAQNSTTDIEYSITVSSGWSVDTVKDEEDNSVTLTDDCYTIVAGPTQHYHTVVVKYIGTGTPSNCSIKVNAVSPYEKELQAIFVPVDNGSMTYSVTNDQDAGVLTIYTNSYVGDVRVIWDSAYCSPDNMNSIMSTWQNSNASVGETFAAEAFHTYTLYFLKNSTSVSLSTADFTVSEVD